MARDELLTKQYQLAVEWVLHQDQRRWTLLGAIVVLEGLIAEAASTIHGQAPNGRLIAFYLSLMGGLFALAWVPLLWQTRVYLRDRASLVRRLSVELGLPAEVAFYTEDLAIPDRTKARKERPGRISLVTRVAYYLLLVIASGWGLIALTMLDATPFPSIYQAIVILELLASVCGIGWIAFGSFRR